MKAIERAGLRLLVAIALVAAPPAACDEKEESDAEQEEGDVGCNPPPGVEGWGGPCDPQDPVCPTDTYCSLLEEFSDNPLGYCAPLCCADSHDIYCADSGAQGEGQCAAVNPETEDRFCVIVCELQYQCPDGTSCQEIESGHSVCYPDPPG